MFIIRFETTHKINLIKTVRAITGWGLREAEDGVKQGIYMPPDRLGEFLLALTTEWWRCHSAAGPSALPLPTFTVAPHDALPQPQRYNGRIERKPQI
jgi:hypothetical protein